MSSEKISFGGTKSILPTQTTSINCYSEGDLLASDSSISSSTVNYVNSAGRKVGSCQSSCYSSDLQVSRSGEEILSKSYKSVQNGVVDGRHAPGLRIPLWVIISLTDLTVVGGTWALIICLNHAVNDKHTSMNPFRGGDIIMPWVYAVYIFVLVISVAVAVAVVCVRKEKEIATRNVQFIVQVMVCTFIALIARLLASMAVYNRLPIQPGTDTFATLSSLLIHTSVAAMVMAASGVTLRLRIIYKIWICNDIDALYAFGLLYHVPLAIAAVAPVFIQDLIGTHLNHFQQYGPIFAVYLFLLGECCFYFWKIQRILSIFVDVSSTLRIGAAFFGMFFFQLIYDIIVARLDVISVLCFIFMTPLTLIVTWLEILGPALVKITGRKLQQSFLGELDLCGIATEFGCRGFDNVLSDPFLLEKLTESCTKQYCTENVMFLKSMLDVRTALNSGTNPARSHLGVCNATAAAMVHAVIERQISKPEPSMEINISSHTKEAILKQVPSLRSDLITDALLNSLNEAEERVCSMLMSAKADFLADSEVSAHLRRLWASERAGLALVGVAAPAAI